MMDQNLINDLSQLSDQQSHLTQEEFLHHFMSLTRKYKSIALTVAIGNANIEPEEAMRFFQTAMHAKNNYEPLNGK